MIRALSASAVFVLPAVALWASGQQPPAPPPGSIPGQQPEVRILLESHQRPLVRLAFPRLNVASPGSREAEAAARELEDTLRADLEEARVFTVQGPAMLSVLELTGDPRRDYEQYRSLGNEVLLAGDILFEGDNIVLEARVIDLASGAGVVGKRYRGPFRAARRIAHTFADEVVLYFTGRRGLALTTLAFSSDRTGRSEIYLMDYDGHSQRRITGHKSISMAPDWSPRQDGLVYTSFFSGPPGIYFADLASGRKLPVVADGEHNFSPSFSPDGKRIAFARAVAGNTDIFAVDRDGSNLQRLTFGGGIDTNPAWSPSGREIAFTSSRTGSPQIYLMDADGTNPRRISLEGEYNEGAAWHPQGTHLAYASRRQGTFQIVITDVVTLETQLLTAGPGDKESPSFSPDGLRIAFAMKLVSGRTADTQIYVMDSRDGGHLRQLTREGKNFAPSWSGPGQ